MTPAPQPEGRNQLLFPANEPALSVNEPMYFVIGSRTTARFQFSFKYRLFDPDSLPVEWFSPLSGLHFGYTQTSLWSLGEDSAPFHDTSYRPSLFWQSASLGKGGLTPDLLRGGYEHESNGKDGTSSRSIDTLFVLTTQTAHFFIERGFALTSPDVLPPVKRQHYNPERGSKVLVRRLSTPHA